MSMPIVSANSVLDVVLPPIVKNTAPYGTSAGDMQKLFGKAVLFVFPDVGWSTAQFASCAQFAHNLGIDTISPKIGEGTQNWYSIQAVKDQRKAVLDAGCGYAPFWYSVGPRWGIVVPECTMMKQYGDANNGIIISDMEVEWNGQNNAATVFKNQFINWSGVLGVTTWADPQFQNWTGVMANLAPCVNLWIPQTYDNWLASQALPPEATIIQRAVDLSQEFGPNNVLSIVGRIASQGGSAWFWDNMYASWNPGLVRQCTELLHRG